MKTLLRTAAIAAAIFVSLDVGIALAQQRPRTQQTVQCDFKTWVRDWLYNKINARYAKDELANTICHFTTDKDYCKVSANFKTMAIRQSKSYQNALANEVLSTQGPSFGVCILCQVRDLFKTVVANPDSVQNLCKRVGELVANRESLQYIYNNDMNCGFKMSQAALTDDTFDDVYWNGDRSIRHWLSQRIIPDLTGGLSDETIGSQMRDVGRALQPFVNKYPPSSQDQNILDQSFNTIGCTSIELPPCTRPVYNCPP